MDPSHPSNDHALAEAAPPASSPHLATPADSSTHGPQFHAGDLIDDRFLVVRFIARGGMGEVYEVEDRQLRGIHVALKTILSQYAADPVVRQRFEREVLSAREVVHPNICPTYDLGHWSRPGSELTYLTMKLLPGESLAARIERAGPPPAEEALAILTQTASGLAAAHSAGILHRDIKSGNIIVQGAGAHVSVWITDFGLARPAVTQDTVLTVHGVVGSPAYMAPELFYGNPPSKSSDIYALGVVAYQLLTGALPHIALGRGKASAPTISAAGIPQPWRRFVEGCLKPSAQDRFQSVPAAVQALPSPAALENLRPSTGLTVSRRNVLIGAAATAGVASAAWLEWPHIANILDPLPSMRFVALMAMPTEHPPALLFTVLDSIGQRLARAESSVKNLLIIAPKDQPGVQRAIDSPEQTEQTLGANLVLTAKLDQTPLLARLNLQLLDAHTQRVMRKATVETGAGDISSLADKASHQAAALLQIPKTDVQLSDPEELKKVPPDAFQAFSEAEQLVNQPNHAGLQQAIDKYQNALDLAPHFALGYAKLAIAYIKQFYVTKEPANIDLAAKNAAAALNDNPRSAMGLMSQAMVFVAQGKSDQAFDFFARAQQADPGNPDILYHKAWSLAHQGNLPAAEKAYRDILVQRPNFWPAYNNLGVILTRDSKYEEAAKAFAAAGAAAPKVAQPMGNLAQTYLELGRRDDARAALNESLRRQPNEDAYLALGDLDFEDAKYTAALADYQHAADLDPASHLVQRNIGDCYAMLGDHAKVKQSYANAARLLSAQLQTNPQDGFAWANLAFYHAKIGDPSAAEDDIKNAQARGATDVASRFMIVQALDVLGKKKEALDLLLTCMDKGLSPAEVDLAVDLKDLRSNPAYQAKLKNHPAKANASSS
jgi:serine/threonine protein kinase/Tfp pilus assembly protein PilF